MCKTQQEESFGMAMADNLGDIHARLRVLMREKFPDASTYDCLNHARFQSSLEVPGAFAAPELVETDHPLQQSATAAAGSPMLELSEISAEGERTVPWAASMRRG